MKDSYVMVGIGGTMIPYKADKMSRKLWTCFVGQANDKLTGWLAIRLGRAG